MTLAIDKRTDSVIGQYICHVNNTCVSILGRYGYVLALAKNITLEEVR
jgi:hypothetical protein